MDWKEEYTTIDHKTMRYSPPPPKFTPLTQYWVICPPISANNQALFALYILNFKIYQFCCHSTALLYPILARKTTNSAVTSIARSLKTIPTPSRVAYCAWITLGRRVVVWLSRSHRDSGLWSWQEFYNERCSRRSRCWHAVGSLLECPLLHLRGSVIMWEV